MQNLIQKPAGLAKLIYADSSPAESKTGSLVKNFIDVSLILTELMQNKTSANSTTEEKRLYRGMQLTAVYVMKLLDNASLRAITEKIVTVKPDFQEDLLLSEVIAKPDGLTLNYVTRNKAHTEQKKVISKYLNLTKLSIFISTVSNNGPFSRLILLTTAYKEMYAIYDFMKQLITRINDDTLSIDFVKALQQDFEVTEEESCSIQAVADSIFSADYSAAKSVDQLMQLKIQELEYLAQKKSPAEEKTTTTTIQKNLQATSKRKPSISQKPPTPRNNPSAKTVPVIDPLLTQQHSIVCQITNGNNDAKSLGLLFRKIYKNEFVYRCEQLAVKQRLEVVGKNIIEEITSPLEKLELEFAQLKTSTAAALDEFSNTLAIISAKIIAYSTELHKTQATIPVKFTVKEDNCRHHKIKRQQPAIPEPKLSQLEVLQNLARKKAERAARRSSARARM
jgi:hypothetical protein